MKLLPLFLATILATALSGMAGIDTGVPASSTPYDSYMQPVKQVLRNLDGENASMERVQALMRQGRSFRYSFTEPYLAASPATTAATKSGDCKAKALWLCDQMGDESVRFVVGKAHRGSRLSHAWVIWQHEGRWWILDPTNTSVPLSADRVSQNDYIPLYSWGKGSTFRHAETSTFLASVAGKRKAPVAGSARN